MWEKSEKAEENEELYPKQDPNKEAEIERKKAGEEGRLLPQSRKKKQRER